MRLLLDTNALIWALAGPEGLAATARDAISSSENKVFVSVVSIWEIGILRGKGRLRSPDDLEFQMAEKAFDALPIRMSHAVTVGSLPSLHRDPFDRMLVAQAQVEELTIVTSDRTIRRYPVSTLPAL